MADSVHNRVEVSGVNVVETESKSENVVHIAAITDAESRTFGLVVDAIWLADDDELEIAVHGGTTTEIDAPRIEAEEIVTWSEYNDADAAFARLSPFRAEYVDDRVDAAMNRVVSELQRQYDDVYGGDDVTDDVPDELRPEKPLAAFTE